MKNNATNLYSASCIHCAYSRFYLLPNLVC